MKNRCLEGIISTIDRAGNDTRRSAKEQFSKYDLPDVTFITVASHDTASAVLGTPGQGERWGYISSGTWSLLGIETKIANVSRNAFLKIIRMNGVPITRCVFENIMGMWLIQEVARMQEYEYSYAELAELAAKKNRCSK